MNDMSNELFIEQAKDYISKKMNIDRELIFVVWLSKTLQNNKALLSFYGQHELGDYIEATRNGDKQETYYDIYKKSSNEAVADSEVK